MIWNVLRREARRFRMASACALAIFSGKNIFYRADSDSLRAVRICIFTERGRNGKMALSDCKCSLPLRPHL